MRLLDLQKEIEKVWTDEFYSKQFKENPSPYKHFQHGALHVGKALQELKNMIEEADHSGKDPYDAFPWADVRKYLADIVISATRMAIQCPSGGIDIENAIQARLDAVRERYKAKP